MPLSTGNVVITAPRDDAGGTDAGAVYLFNGATGGLISTLTGSTANDMVGSGGVMALANGNFVILSPSWINGAAPDAGAVTWGSGTSGVSGVVSTSNSLVGSTANDRIGFFDSVRDVTALPNGNYVVRSPDWDNGAAANAGAVTWGSGTSGVSGVVSTSNSLVGTTSGDNVGIQPVTVLASGNYVVTSSNWDNGPATDAGAVTLGSGNSGISGVVSASNSLVGGTANDRVGLHRVVALANGNYVVSSPEWNNGAATDAGAVSWGSGTTGITGLVSGLNSLVGSNTNDSVGRGPAGTATAIRELANGNYVVITPWWRNGAAANAGAVTWGSGTSGVAGVVSALNSLVGSSASDFVGLRGVIPLTNGNYVVSSASWNNGALADVGAVTWGNGATGITGVVSALNSLVGSTAIDAVGWSTSALTNGNYVVTSPFWDNGPATDAGAITWGNGTSGVTGIVSASNSLVGSTANDTLGGNPPGFLEVGSGVRLLPNGNYVVSSPFWDNGVAANAGAVTWANGTSGITGVVTASNSLVGGNAGDRVGGADQNNWLTVMLLTNGNFIIRSPLWNGSRAQ